MVQPEVVEAASLGVETERAGDLFEQLGRRIADADDAIAGGPHRFGDHAHRIGEVDDPGSRRRLSDLPRIVDHWRDGSCRHGEAGGPNRLLTDNAVPLRRSLVADPLLDAADADTGEDD